MFKFLNMNTQENANAKFLEAVKKGDFTAVHTLLHPTKPEEPAAAIDATCRDGYSAPYYALSIKDETVSLSMLDTLLIEKFDINRLDGPEKTTILTKAIQQKKVAAIHFLLSKNADVKTADSQMKIYPIHAAAEANLPDIVGELHSRGADITVETTGKYTALHLAVQKKSNYALAELLKINSTNEFLNARALWERTALIDAANGSNLDGIKLLVQAGANIHLLDRFWSAFGYALQRENLPVVTYLLECGAFDTSYNCYSDFYTKNVAPLVRRNLNLLHYAENNLIKEMENCISDGAHLETITDWEKSTGETALLIAARKGHLECVQLLLKNGANDKAKNKRGETLSLLAVKNLHPELIRFLMDTKRIDPDMKIDGLSLLQFSIKKRSPKVLSVFIEKIEKIDSLLLYAAEFGDANILQILLPMTALQYKDTDKQWNNVFHLATRNSEDVIDLIVQAMTHRISNLAELINGANMDSLTPLMCAAQAHSADVSTLLRHGADATARTGNGLRAVDIAVKSKSKLHAESTKILVYHMLSHGLDLKVGTAISLLNDVGLTKADMCNYISLLCDSLDNPEAKLAILTAATGQHGTPLSEYMYANEAGTAVEPRSKLDRKLEEFMNSNTFKDLLSRKNYQINKPVQHCDESAPPASAPPPPYATENNSSTEKTVRLSQVSEDIVHLQKLNKVLTRLMINSFSRHQRTGRQ